MQSKFMSGIYYGPDAEIARYPRAAECQGKCGHGYNCGTCMYGVISTEDRGPQRCMYMKGENQCTKEQEI